MRSSQLPPIPSEKGYERYNTEFTPLPELQPQSPFLDTYRVEEHVPPPIPSVYDNQESLLQHSTPIYSPSQGMPFPDSPYYGPPVSQSPLPDMSLSPKSSFHEPPSLSGLSGYEEKQPPASPPMYPPLHQPRRYKTSNSLQIMTSYID